MISSPLQLGSRLRGSQEFYKQLNAVLFCTWPEILPELCRGLHAFIAPGSRSRFASD